MSKKSKNKSVRIATNDSASVPRMQRVVSDYEKKSANIPVMQTMPKKPEQKPANNSNSDSNTSNPKKSV